jgi:hypothetical protein
MHERFGIPIFWLWRPLFLLFGATRSRAYVDVGPERIAITLGWYSVELQRANVTAWEITSIPWWWGRGWRSNLRDMIALVGVGDPVLKLTLTEPVRSRVLLIPLRLRTVYVSVDDVPRLERALEERRYGARAT